ncbi:hypothetical protein AGRHK599_LOCUS4891 [Rhizobium rhizogenes]|uniref:GSCFA domain-containing protein n=1 Tax=Rhizobium rhizogenes TaxID=359 RepID=A0AAN2AAV6_RHIRH|nr:MULTISPECIES: GSCFA domain-containing protein [Rhizobium/Agrobacterium group]AQS63440.1 GSCFA domain protein [Rhizobium rhizogenes]MCZ7441290.1 GSCFA domain-containing protein [Rhizobium rhizogenes]NSZ82340.1 GSCFA domain-containing protein [Agrobacterium tumefaciens]OAM62664.1 hypothetical protein A8L48_00195 [Rhizobium rhizogenes]UXT50589.1 GSCFA domain-containing protein [Agrobacterium tumefaciens]
MRTNSPYAKLPDTSFWKRSVSGLSAQDVDPLIATPFTIGTQSAVATAGSCFAQHISRTLSEKGFNYLVPETGPADKNYGVYPCRFGNIYTVRQLLQTFERAYGLRASMSSAWRRGDVFIDPYRPQIEPDGFASLKELEDDRFTHLEHVRAMFEKCDVFIFTLGLTEGWETSEGTVVPLAPGVAGYPEDTETYQFKNYNVLDMVSDFSAFMAKFRRVNPSVKVLLTVSPVPLIATFEKRHVLEANVYSKSALRVAADMICQSDENVHYFPSYEIITGPHNGYRYFESDLRSVSPAGVAQVMSIFSKHFLTDIVLDEQPRATPTIAIPTTQNDEPRHELYEIICDEEAIDP